MSGNGFKKRKYSGKKYLRGGFKKARTGRLMYSGNVGTSRQGKKPNYGNRNPIAKWGRIYGGSLLPQNLRTTFSYHQTWADTTAAGFAQYAYRANSLYDPDLSGVGTKAIGVTAMGGIYNRYRVLSSKVHLTVINNDADDPIHIAIVPQKTSTALTVASKESVPAQPGCSWDIITNQTGKGTISNYCNVAALSGTGSANQETFTATFGNNPTTEVYYILYLWNESGNALNAEATIVITFDTICSDIDYANITGS